MSVVVKDNGPFSMEGSTFAERMIELVKRVSNGNEAAFARLCDIDPKSVARYQAGTKPTLESLVSIASKTGASLDWLARGIKTDNSPRTADKCVEIPVLAFRASGGRGQLVLDGESGRFLIPRVLLDRQGIRSENARALVLEGDSMLPTIGDGDTLVLDVSRQQLIEGRVFAFTIGNEAYVKRLRRSPGRLIMVSDNVEAFPPEPIPPEEDFRIIGQVRWAERVL